MAIVTGAARPWGLGRVTAVQLAQQGFDVVVADVRENWGAEAVEAIRGAPGVKALFLKTDVSSRSSVQSMVRETLDNLGRIDVLVNNAAVFTPEPAEQFSDAAFDRMVNVNLRGPMLTCQAVIPVMRAQGGGRIINVASRGGRRPTAGSGIYGATKAGLIMYTRVLALETARDNIFVTTVSPGGIITGIGSEEGPTQSVRDVAARGHPMGRGLEPAEVAEVIVFVATTDSPALIGQTLWADGGAYMV